MIAEEPKRNNIPNISVPKGTTITYLLDVITKTIVPFKKARTQSNLLRPLNENKLTQIFVEQLEVQIKPNPFVGVKNQYYDLFEGTKGVPDFYFHTIEEGATHRPLFVVEAKRLPSPSYEKEYVIGEIENGGIERYKLEKHGKGLVHGGILGFIEKEDAAFWLKAINTWIEDLSEPNSLWNKNEVLLENENQIDYVHLKSTIHRLTSQNMLLEHFWIKCT